MSLLDQLAPGGSLEWAVSGSGLGGIADLRLLDTLGDGQRMDTVFHPQVVIRRGSTTLFSGDLQGWSGVRSADTATTAINFDLAPTLRAAGLAGGLSDDSTVTVTFHSTIASLYAARQAPALGRVLGQGDLLRNTAVFSGTVAGALSSSDPAAASLALPSSVLSTSIYAVNGVLAAGTAHAAYGDTVTYRIQLGLPLTAAHHVQLTATLPGLTGPFVFDPTGTMGGPASGHAQFGPGGTYTATQPLATLATDAAGNPAVRFDFGDIQPVYGSHPGTIDLLVSAPLAPGAPLAATVTETEANSFGTSATVSAATSAIALNEPSLHIQTATVYASNDHANWTGTGGPFGYSPDFGQFGGVISSAGLATEPFADQLYGIDAGDDVTFVIAVENLMPGAKAYDVMVRAALPDGFAVPPGGDASVTVLDGAGTPLAYSGSLFDPQGGILLDSKAPIGGFDANSGQNILLISYTLRSTDRLDLGVPNHVSTAQIISYATEPGWANRAPLAAAGANTATTGAANLQPGVAIALVSTGPNTAGTLLALGANATFRLTATLPEGLSRGLDLSILLPAWLTAVSARVVAVGANIAPQTQAADGHGGIAFGDTLNAPDGQDTAADQVQIEVTVRPDRLPDGPAPHTQTIQAAVSIGPPGQVGTVMGGVAVGVADPVPPAITEAFAGTGTLANGQVATLRLTVTLPPGFSTDLRIMDSLPAGLAYVPGSAHVVQAGGVASHGAATLSAPSEQRTGSLLTLDFGAVDAAASANRQVTVELQAQVAAAVGTTLLNSVAADTGYAAAAASLSAPVANTAPVLTGLPALAVGRDDTALSPFGGIVVTDPDTGQQQTLQITFSPSNGVLTNLGAGRYDALAGTYAVTGTADAVMAAAAGLRFIPTRHQTSLGQQVATDFSVQVRDGAGAGGAATVMRVLTTAADTAPVIRNAAPGQAMTPGAQVRLFSGLSLQDLDAGQTERLSIQLADPAIGTLRGAGPGYYNPATGLFTSTGTLPALMAEAAGLVFAGARPGETFVTVTVDDNAGGVAQDTSTLTVSAGTPSLASAGGGPPPFAPTLLPTPLFLGSAPANPIAVPAGTSLLAGTAGRDAYFVDGAAGPQWDTLTGFGGGDAVVLWGFRAGISAFTWSNNDGPAGYTGRTLRADIPGTGAATTSLTFTGRTATDTDRFAISTGRFNGLDFLSIASPP